jgi:protein tyrosine phosphatase
MISKAITESKRVVDKIDPYQPQLIKTPPVDFLKNTFKALDFSSKSPNGFDDCDDYTNMKKYISACYINGLVKNYSEKSIIACQGPVMQTISKFWQMVWENKVTLIVMLCPFGDYDKSECIDYWSLNDKVGDLCLVGPSSNESLLKIRFMEKKFINERMTLRKLKLIYGEESLDIEHL